MEDLVKLSGMLQDGKPLDEYFAALSQALDSAFTHTSCTVLFYDRETQTLVRLYSSNTSHSVGTRKRVNTESFWSQTVLKGRVLVGSTAEDMKSFFSEHEQLKAMGWNAILNTPVCRDGQTIGSINIMNGEHTYDKADQGLARTFAQITVPAIETAAAKILAHDKANGGVNLDEIKDYV